MSYNLPKLCPSATWNPTVNTLGNNWKKDDSASSVFVNTNNMIYVAVYSADRVLAFVPGKPTPNKTYSSGLKNPGSVFATVNGDLYIGNEDSNKRVERWNSTSTSGAPVMTTPQVCFGLFIDISNTLYCSMNKAHQVIRRSLNNSNTSGSTAAGNGSPGSDNNQLDRPYGIFVNTYLTLFVADYGNDRIQRFDFGNRNGTTVVLNGFSGSLSQPSGVVLDADGYLFIADSGNSRIIGSGPKGFRILIDRLQNTDGNKKKDSAKPMSLSFDSGGNIYITGTITNPVQKVKLATNSCGNFS